MAKRVLLVGGGSGGHAYPLLAVAQAIKAEAEKNNTKVEFLMLGSPGFLQEAARESGIRWKRVTAGKLRRYLDPRMTLDFIKIPISFVQSFWHLFWFMPDIIFSKGGYDSVAPAIVGWLYMIPVFIHESDSVPGLANRIIAKFAQAVFLGFQSAQKYFPKNQTIVVGNPVRTELLSGNKQNALEFFNLKGDKKTILIMGGSQGAKQINDIIIDALVLLVRDYQIIHQSGETQYASLRKEVDKIISEGEQEYGGSVRENYRLFPFLGTRELALAYALADCVVSRAGAGSLFEIAALGKPAVVIPLAQASRGEQLLNAAEFSKFGAAVIEGANLTPNILINQIESALNRYAEIGQRIKTFATPDSASTIASALLSN